MKTRLSLFFAVLAAIAACQPAPSPKDETVELVNLGEDEYAFPVDGGDANLRIAGLSAVPMIGFLSVRKAAQPGTRMWKFPSSPTRAHNFALHFSV